MPTTEDPIRRELSTVFGEAAAADQRAEDLERDLALAESRIELLERQLITAGADPNTV